MSAGIGLGGGLLSGIISKCEKDTNDIGTNYRFFDEDLGLNKKNEDREELKRQKNNESENKLL